MASIVSAGTTSATALNMSADTSGVLQLASNNGTVALTIATNQNVTLAANLTIGSSLTVGGAISPAYLVPNGGPRNTAGLAGNWWYIGTITLGDSYSATLRLDGTQSYSAGSSVAGSTYLHLRGTNSASTIEGYFYGTTQGNTNITSIAWKNVSGSVFDLWVKLQDYASAVVYCDTNGTYTPASTDTGSTTQPSGSTAFSSFWTVSTAGNERVRVLSGGEFLVGTTTTPVATYNCFSENGADVQLILQRVGDGGGYGGIGASSANALNVYGSTSGLSQRFFVTQAGSCLNVTGSYGTISDLKIKENIEDARDYLSDLCKVRIVKYSLKEDKRDTPDKLGVIAQELEQIFPQMIEEVQDVDNAKEILDTKTKTVKYSVFVPMLIKAIQEQQATIEQLKADVAALKGAA